MTLEALASNELPNFLIYDTIAATPTSLLCNGAATAGNGFSLLGFFGEGNTTSKMMHGEFVIPGSGDLKTGQGKRKRRRRPRSCKNKEEAENQRMTHIAIERNRRRQMNEHLAVLRSLMPESYVHKVRRNSKGDQASIVGGAIDFVKELEQLLQSLEAQKRTLQQQQQQKNKCQGDILSVCGSIEGGGSCNSNKSDDTDAPPFAQFFAYPQYIWCHAPRDYQVLPERHRSPVVADIEVTLIETHANLRILSPRRPRQLLKLVAGLQALNLTILHLNVTTLESMVLYSVSTKVEEGCGLTTIDDIAAAVHHILSLIEAESTAYSPMGCRAPTINSV